MEVAPKRLELLHELLPSVTTMAILVNPAVPALAGPVSRLSQAAAQSLGLQLHVVYASSFQFAPLKSGVATSIWRQEGYMAPKPKPASFEFTVGMVLAMALTILVVMTWAVAAPSSSPVYHPQLLLLY